MKNDSVTIETGCIFPIPAKSSSSGKFLSLSMNRGEGEVSESNEAEYPKVFRSING